MTAARIKAADFLKVSSRSTPEQWAEVDRLEHLLIATEAEAVTKPLETALYYERRVQAYRKKYGFDYEIEDPRQDAGWVSK